jgi:DNA-binding beta-propeller fold protein YncE
MGMRFIGQESICRELDIIIPKARDDITFNPSILFTANSGLGKTDLGLRTANLISKGNFSYSIADKTGEKIQSILSSNSGNNRIQHLSPDGKVLQVWGTFADISKGDAPGGTFNEPWGVAVGPDGSVYVADTWNYRIQKFSADGKFLSMWGHGPADTPDAFYGPRGIVVDTQGHVIVADTGNKRILIFDANGTFLAQFGSQGLEAGQFDEPVDVALDSSGNIYVTDTWNQRIQVFSPDPTGLVFTLLAQWPIDGWYSQSLDNKPFITVDAQADSFVTDPEGCRVIEFSPEGQA